MSLRPNVFRNAHASGHNCQPCAHPLHSKVPADGNPACRRLPLLLSILSALLVVGNASAQTYSWSTRIIGTNFNAVDWSPDGSRLAVSRGNGTIWTVHSDGSSPVQITAPASGKTSWAPVCRPNSTQLYYLDNVDVFHWLIATEIAGGGGRNKLVMVPGGDGFSSVSFAPDGNLFTYLHCHNASPNSKILETANANGASVTIVPTDNSFQMVSWGRGISSNKFAVTRLEGGLSAVFVLNKSGSGMVRVTSAELGECFAPHWAPGGGQLAFARKATGETNQQIWVINTDGSGARAVTSDSYNNTTPKFSPDGFHIAYISTRSGIDYLCLATLSQNSDFLVVDLSGGTNAASYEVSYLSGVPVGGWTDEYKTSKLVMRRIPAGTFTMGSPTNEVGRGTNEPQHTVTLTKGYYTGVFEVTQRQWELVMGERPSYFNNDAYYASRPVERFNLSRIRGSSAGAGWPGSSVVDADSFVGKLRAKTGVSTFDLPTEAQWEYACRAGTVTAFNGGTNSINVLGRYLYNGTNGVSNRGVDTGAGTTKVGSYLPNAWGLYDMHGNVSECCLDWYGMDFGMAEDPVGATAGTSRVRRGGSWYDASAQCRSAYRCGYSTGIYYIGFRVASAVPPDRSVTVVGGTGGGTYAAGAIVPVTASAPAAGQMFLRWTVAPDDADLGDAFVGTDASTTLILPDKNVTLTAVFATARKIATITDLQKIGIDPAYPSDGGYVLTADIDASATTFWNGGAGLKPIGADFDSMFTGVLDGKGHAIKGLKVVRPTQNNVGLFGLLDVTATIRDLSMTNCYVSGSNCVGGLVGAQMGRVQRCRFSGTVVGIGSVGGLAGTSDGIIEGCSATGAVTGKEYVGGLLGYNCCGLLAHSSAAVTVIGGDDVGGLVGYSSETCVGVRACYATGSVSGTSTLGDAVFGYNFGGLIGNNDSTVWACYATGDVLGGYCGVGVGGFVGANRHGLITDCFSTGRAEGCSDVGRLAGINGVEGEGYGKIERCYAVGTFGGYCFAPGYDPGLVCSNFGAVDGSYLDAVVGALQGESTSDVQACTTAQMREQATFVGWDFVSVWGISQDADYPYLLACPSCTVAFDAEGGTVAPAMRQAIPGRRYGVLPTPVRTGYAFAGWCTGDNGTGALVTSETVVAMVALQKVYAKWIAFPKLTVTGGGVEGEDGNVALVAPGEERRVFANDPTAGKAFDKWTVSPATANLGEGFNAHSASTTVIMPLVNVTLTAGYVAIPKLTVMGGGIEGVDVNYAYVLPGEERQMYANEVAGKVFEKWTVSPATAALSAAFNPRQAQTTVVMPVTSVTVTAVYVTAPGSLTVHVSGSNPDEELSGILWTVDNVTWAPVNDGNSYPLKPGTYTVSFKSTNARWLAPAKQSVKVVFDQAADVSAVATYVPIVSWQMSGDSASGSGAVTLSPGNGQVLPGKSVTLTAKPAANYVFVGWAGFDGISAGAERSPTLTVAPTGDTVYTARFRAKIDCELPEISLDASTACMVGVAYSAVVNVNDGALPVKFTATSLPTGLKIDPVTGAISGVPTKTGPFSVKLNASGESGSAAQQTYAFTVEALPAWAQGTFDGNAHLSVSVPGAETADEFPGTAAMSVTAQGKITGKISCGGTNYNFTAPSYSPTGEGFGMLAFEADAKAGNTTLPVHMLIGSVQVDLPDYGVSPALGVASGCSGLSLPYGDCDVNLWRNIWKDLGMTAVATNYTGYYTSTLPGGEGYGSGYLAFTVDRAGGVKTAGKLADGTAVSLSGSLVMNEGGAVRVILYTAPTAYKGGCFFGVAEFVRSDDGTVLLRLADMEDPMLWDNRSPQATGEYGAMFARSVGISGGRYNTLINLRNYYENGLTVGGVAMPALSASVKHTDWNETQTGKITQTLTEYQDAVGTTPEGLVLSVTPAMGTLGTGLSAPKVDIPLKNTETGEYDYTADTTGDYVSNTSGLTLTYTRATGLFTGSFKTWYDYASAVDTTPLDGPVQTKAHTSKTASFEGALTPVRESGDAEGRGFFLWADKSSFDSGKVDKHGEPIMTPYSFNWSYDFLLLVN